MTKNSPCALQTFSTLKNQIRKNETPNHFFICLLFRVITVETKVNTRSEMFAQRTQNPMFNYLFMHEQKYKSLPVPVTVTFP